MTRNQKWEMALVVVALLSAMAASLAWFLVPAASSTNTVHGVVQHYSRTLSEQNGTVSVWWFIAPVLITFVPLFLPRARHSLTVIAASLLLLFCLLTGF